MLIIYGAFYPGKEVLANYSNLISESAISFVFSGFDANQPGWVFWLSILFTILFYAIAVAAILLGSKIIPTKDSHSVELFMGNHSISHRRFYLENLVTTITILILSISLYSIILILFTIIQNSSDILNRLLITSLFLLLSGIFYLTFTSVITIANFSSTTGKAAGFGYLIFSFLLESIISSDPENLEVIGNFSINFAIKLSNNIIQNEYQWMAVIIILTLSTFFIIVSALLVTRPNYIERSNSWCQKFQTTNLSSINPANLLAPKSYIGRKSPLFTEQLRKDFMPTIIVLLLLSLFHLSIYFTIPVNNETLGMVLAAIDTPLLRAFIQNNEIQPSFLGYLAIKFYGYLWIYFGIFGAILASSIATREVKTKSQDILWSTNIKHSQVIINRLIAITIELSIVIWYIYLLSTLFGNAQNVEIASITELKVFVVIWIMYMSLMIFLVGVTMIPPVSKGRTLGMLTFIFMVAMNIIAFFNPAVEFLKYSSILGYFDPVALSYGKISFLSSVLIGIVILAFSIAFTTILFLYRYRFNDLN